MLFWHCCFINCRFSKFLFCDFNFPLTPKYRYVLIKTTDSYNTCVFSIHRKDTKENSRRSSGPKNSEETTNTHEKSQWSNLRVAASVGMGTDSMEHECVWSEVAWAHQAEWILGTLTANQSKFPSWKCTSHEGKLLEIKLNYERSMTIEIKEKMYSDKIVNV